MKKRVFALAACLLLVMVTTMQLRELHRLCQSFHLAGRLLEEVLFVKLMEILNVLVRSLRSMREHLYRFLEWIRNGYGACFRRMHCQKW